MGILAINAMSVKDQNGTGASSRAGSHSLPDVAFATELDQRLQVTASPAATSVVSRPGRASGKSNSSNDPSAITSTPAQVSSVGQDSHLERTCTTSQHGSQDVAGGVTDRLDSSANREVASFEPPANPANLVLRGIDSNTLRFGVANDVTSESTKAALPPFETATAQLTPQEPSNYLHPKAEAPRSNAAKVPSANPAAPTRVSSTTQASRLVKTLTSAQSGSGPVVPSMPEQVDSRVVRDRIPQGTLSILTSAGIQSAGGELPNPCASDSRPPASAGDKLRGDDCDSGNPYLLNDTSLKRPDTLDKTSLSRSSRASQRAAAEATAPVPNVMPQSEIEGSSEQTDALDATGPSGPNTGSPNVASETLASSHNVTAEADLQRGHKPKNEASHYDGSMASSPNHGTPADSNLTLGTSEIAQVARAGQVELGLVRKSDPAPDRTVTLRATGRSSMNKGLQGAGVESTLNNQRHDLQAAGAGIPMRQSAAHSQPQDPTSAPQTSTDPEAESSPDSASHSQDPPGLEPQGPSIVPASWDASLAASFELSKAVSSGRVDGPGDSSRSKNSQEGNDVQSGSSGDLPPDVTPDLLAQPPAQTPDKEAASPAHDARQAGASEDKKGGEATPDLAKTADGNHAVSKTTADPTVTAQFGPQGRAEAGRTSPEAAGASQGRGESESASVLAGNQSNVHGVVSAARFTQQAGNAELQVRLRSEALGPIDVHTSVKGSDIGASIRVEARDTQVMLASELSQLEQALKERSLRVQRLDVLQGSVSGGQSNGTGPDNSHGSPSQPRPGLASHSAGQAFPGLPEAPTLYEDGGLDLSTTRINLRV